MWDKSIVLTWPSVPSKRTTIHALVAKVSRSFRVIFIEDFVARSVHPSVTAHTLYDDVLFNVFDLAGWTGLQAGTGAALRVVVLPRAVNAGCRRPAAHTHDTPGGWYSCIKGFVCK